MKGVENFGVSQFKGKHGIKVDIYRWSIQFITLLVKNFIILYRRPMQALLFVCLPSCVILPFLIETNSANDNNDGLSVQYPSTPLTDLGPCNVYYAEQCIRVVYGYGYGDSSRGNLNPNYEMINDVMKVFSELNDLEYGVDVRGYPNSAEAEEFVANNIGKVQYTRLST